MMTVKKLYKHRTNRQKLNDRLDALLHDIVVARDHNCVTCGKNYNLTAGHLFTRSYGRIKYDLSNVHCQCKGCNLQHEYRPDIFTHWFIEKFGAGKYNELFVEAHKPVDPIKVWQLEMIEDQLKVIKKSLEV
jgi:hypothetical protein